MKVAAIVPTRLAVNPMSTEGNLFLDRSLMGVKRQTRGADIVVVGTDAGQTLPERFSDVEHAQGAQSQAEAVNVAAERAIALGADVLAFLEDDDYWHPEHLACALRVLTDERMGFWFVSSNQLEVELDGSFCRHNDFATPSGWVMYASTWVRIGGMTPGLLHCDTEWLGRLNARISADYGDPRKKRCHLVERGAPDTKHPQRRDWLAAIARFTYIAETELKEPTVTRFRNPAGGMASIESGQRTEQSMREHKGMMDRFGVIPW